MTALASYFWQNDYEGAITAVGANQGAAYGLTKHVSRVTGGATAGVRLPAAVRAGEIYIVLNDTAASPGAGLSSYINVYPASGETILPNSVNVRDYLSSNLAGVYVSLGSGEWEAIPCDMKSDHVNRTIGDFCTFYGAATFVNGLTSSSTTDLTGAVTMSASFTCSGIISPTALGAGPTANYAPTGLSTCSVIRQDMSAAGVVSGLTAQASGRTIKLFNISGTALNTLTLNHEDAASTAANRFVLPANSNLVIPCNSGVELWYDGTSSRWRVAGGI